MSKRFNNKYLLFIFAILIALFVFVKFYKSAKNERTLKTNIVDVDTSRVTKILLYPTTEKSHEVEFTKDGNEWMVSNGKIKVASARNSVKNLFDQLLEIEPKRLVSRTKEKWSEYQLTDTSATQIKIFEGDDEKLHLYIGKFTYQQTQDPYAAYGRGGGIVGTSYVRLANEKEIYAVDGFLTFAFNQPFNSWRDQTFIKFNKSDITKLTFRYPGDSSFVISLQNRVWVAGNQVADSIKVLNYLGQISFKNASTFDDTFTPLGNSTYQLTVEGNNMSNITIDVFLNNGIVTMNSSQNPKSWFTSDKNGIFKDIFINKRTLLSKK